MHDQTAKVIPVLLAGGTGTRLWPVSRELYPKQLVKFIGEDSLVQSTIKRLAPVLDPDSVRIVCGERHFHETIRHLADIGLSPEGKVISEPSGRNTAPAILLAVFHARLDHADAILCVFPADHVIADLDQFHDRLRSAIRLAQLGYIVTFGIKPHYPETGYGYVEGGGSVSEGALRIKRFVEKPDLQTAEKYLQAGNFFWNSGMFAFKVSVLLEEFQNYQPEILRRMNAIFAGTRSISKKKYEQLPDISIDYAIMEKTDKGVVLPSDFGWSDIGSWKSLYDFLPKDADNNVIDGDVIAQHTRNCFILGYERLIAANHLVNTVIVETPDSIFVSDIDHSRDVKTIVANLKKEGRKEYHQHRTLYFPWGNATVLEQQDEFKISRLTVNKNGKMAISTEGGAPGYLFVLKGTATVIIGGQSEILQSGQAIALHKKQRAKVENCGGQPLILIQVETVL